MIYKRAKIYYDGSHYIAIPSENFSHKKGGRKKSKDDETLVTERKERQKTNAIKRQVRLMRKLYLQEWNYFCTFTYDEAKHNEDTFKEKLRNTLKHLVYRKSWKYIGAWERSPDKQRLHFHGIFFIPQMIGELIETTDYSTTNHRMQIAYQNTHFLKHFGRNDFKALGSQADVIQSVRYLMKYISKSGEKLAYGGKLPTYFLSDVVDEDIACEFGVDNKKAVLFDDFTCYDEGELIGIVSQETINQLPKSN